MSRRRHAMPFGAEFRGARGTAFRLWAPAAHGVELLLYGHEEGHDGGHGGGTSGGGTSGGGTSGGAPRALPLSARPDGWFELETRAAGPGAHYRFRIDGALEVPDPASRWNAGDVMGPSVVVDPEVFEWTDGHWRGRPWKESVIYEMHVGTFSPEGTFAGAEARLDHLVQLGANVLELMPIAEFAGSRGWGYDGVLPFAPDSSYGRPEDLKSLIAAAHRRGIAVMLDVVYNHFGPEGNWLPRYAPAFFTHRHETPWGAAMNFDDRDSSIVREFFAHNALYWIEEYNADGLRFDAVHAIRDESEPHILEEISQRVRTGPGRGRHMHLVLENGDNAAHLLGPPGTPGRFDAQWNDDFHHCLHVILTGERDGYYHDFATRPHTLLARCLTEGFAFQGEPFEHHGGQPRGEPSVHLPPTAFVTFLQNHDQIGNRALGERLAHLVGDDDALLAATALLLLAPSPPLIFMGEEWAAREPFPYFCDFTGELARAVRDGRRREFAGFERFGDEAAVAAIPDPNAASTCASARLDWTRLGELTHLRWLERYRELLAIRRREIAPRIPETHTATAVSLHESGAFAAEWMMSDGATLRVYANLTAAPAPVLGRPGGRPLYTAPLELVGTAQSGRAPPWAVAWSLEVAPTAADPRP